MEQPSTEADPEPLCEYRGVFSLAGVQKPTTQAADQDAARIPKYLRAARRLVDAVRIESLVQENTYWPIDPVGGFGVESPAFEAREARDFINTGDLAALVGLTRSGWVLLHSRVLTGTRSPNVPTWEIDGIEAAADRLRAAFAREYPNTPSDQDECSDSSPSPATEQAHAPLTVSEQASQVVQSAWRLYEHGVDLLGEGATDKAVYAKLQELLGGQSHKKLPCFDTWARYVRKERSQRGKNKNRPRVGRTARSVVKHDER